MKKLIAMIMALCLMCGGAALADDVAVTGDKASTLLQTRIDEGYTIMIPATLDIPFNQVKTPLDVEVTELHLNPERKLEVRLWDTGALTNGTGGKLGNAIEGSDLENNWYLYFTELGEKTVEIKIPKASWNKAPAGEYTSTLKFFIKIVDTND